VIVTVNDRRLYSQQQTPKPEKEQDGSFITFFPLQRIEMYVPVDPADQVHTVFLIYQYDGNICQGGLFICDIYEHVLRPSGLQGKY
jgi:hypothetical protein